MEKSVAQETLIKDQILPFHFNLRNFLLALFATVFSKLIKFLEKN